MANPIPHLAIPFTLLPDGTAAVVQQDTLADIVQCVGVIVATPIGSRIVLPAFGIPDQTFGNGQMGPIEAACAQWEPRATVKAMATINPQNPRETDITVTVKAAGT